MGMSRWELIVEGSSTYYLIKSIICEESVSDCLFSRTYHLTRRYVEPQLHTGLLDKSRGREGKGAWQCEEPFSVWKCV
jgi:hypothetical protein